MSLREFAPLPSEPRRLAIEPIPSGGGWLIHAPSNGRIGMVYAQADTAEELVAWAKRKKAKATVI